ncbi:MAG: hypothetical protein II674_04050, partial [Prevotella sp.]|nr:hypothetical protein [Prevotella sp.]
CPSVNDYARSVLQCKDGKHSKRCLDYKAFEENLYADCPNVKTTFLGSSFNFEVDGVKIGIAAYNSAWCSYDDDDSVYGLYLSEPQFNETYEQIKNCDLKIALMHHPLDWLKVEKQTIISENHTSHGH